ncbi:MAG: cupredoxin domain-containing protein [Elusimicrobiota bacterium]
MIKYLVFGFLVFGILACAKKEEVSKTTEMGTSEMKGHEGTEAVKKEGVALRTATADEVGKDVVCPVMRNVKFKVKSITPVADYKGKSYYLCCGACPGKFSEDPEKYISRIKEIKLETFQFGFSPDPVVVKKGDIVKLEITSRDVSHGVYIKEYGIKIPVKKGEIKKVEFLAAQEGKFDILCSVFCGSGHSKMKGRLVVEKQ